MFIKSISSKYLRLKIYSPTILIFLSLNLFAQNESIQSFYKDSTGKLFIATGTHVFLFIGTSSNASKSYQLKGDNGNAPIHWSGHGLKHLTHLNLFLGHRVSFDLFADALPPKTSVDFGLGKKDIKNDKIYLSGQGIIQLNATDPDAGLKGIYYSINDGENIRYIEPITLKTEGEYKLSVFALDNVGNKEEEFTRTIVVDNTPPLSRLDIEGDKFENIVSGRSNFTITSTDALGVKQTLYGIDSSKMIPYSKPIKMSGLNEGEHTIYWYSIDDVENIEATKSLAFFLDKTPPMVFEEVTGNTYMVAGKEYSSGRSQLKIVAVDNKAGIKEIKYSLNQADFKLYEKPIYLSDILGVVSIRSYAIDNVNNRSQSDSQSETFSMPTVDITGPQISYSFIGPKIILKDTTWVGSKTKIQITSKDIGSGVNRISYKEKGGEEKIYTEPFSVENKGFHEVTCTAFDNVENVNFITFGFSVDNQAPSIYYHYSIEPSGWITENGEKIPIFLKGLKLYLAATDNLSGVDKLYFTLDHTKETLYTLPIEGFKSGITHFVVIKAIDILGNTSENSIKFRVE